MTNKKTENTTSAEGSRKGEIVILPDGREAICLDDECLMLEYDPKAKKGRLKIKDDCPTEKKIKYEKIFEDMDGLDYVMPKKKRQEDEDET